MKFKIQKLSSVYQVRKLTPKDVLAILELAKTNPYYYECIPPAITAEAIKKDMKALPPHTTLKDKFYVGFFKETKLVAVLDLIFNYPNTQSIFIGFFMMHKKYQRQGIGSRIVQELLSCLPNSYTEAYLGVTSKNEISKKFWEKNGFKLTGKEYHHPRYTVQMMNKKLLPDVNS